MSARINYKQQGEGTPIILIHGLFGDLANLGLLARDLSKDHQVISVDLRNHGLSFHSDTHTYQAMAQDIHQLMVSLSLDNAIVIGHSMGGKVAMKLAGEFPTLVSKLVVMDMAPVAYKARKHDNVFAGLSAVTDRQPTNRSEAMTLMAAHIELDGVRQFLGKSLYWDDNKVSWRFNVRSLFNNYWEILGWEPIQACQVPTLFLKGADSDYLTQEHQQAIQQQFPKAKAHVIANTGHWLHAEKPQEVLRAIRRFIESN